MRCVTLQREADTGKFLSGLFWCWQLHAGFLWGNPHSRGNQWRESLTGTSVKLLLASAVLLTLSACHFHRLTDDDRALLENVRAATDRSAATAEQSAAQASDAADRAEEAADRALRAAAAAEETFNRKGVRSK